MLMSHGQATDQGAESREGDDARIQKRRAAQRQGWPRGDEPTASHCHRLEQKGQGIQAWPKEGQKRLTQPQKVRAMPYIAIAITMIWHDRHTFRPLPRPRRS